MDYQDVWDLFERFKFMVKTPGIHKKSLRYSCFNCFNWENRTKKNIINCWYDLFYVNHSLFHWFIPIRIWTEIFYLKSNGIFLVMFFWMVHFLFRKSNWINALIPILILILLLNWIFFSCKSLFYYFSCKLVVRKESILFCFWKKNWDFFVF